MRAAAEKLQKLKPVPLTKLADKCSKNENRKLDEQNITIKAESHICALGILQNKASSKNVDQRKFFFATMQSLFHETDRWKEKRKTEHLLQQVCDYQLYQLQQQFYQLSMNDAPEVKGKTRSAYIWDCFRQVYKIDSQTQRNTIFGKVIADYLKYGLNENGRKDRESFVKKPQMLPLEDQLQESHNAASSSSAPPLLNPLSPKDKEMLEKAQMWKAKVVECKRKAQELKEAEENKFKKKKKKKSS